MLHKIILANQFGPSFPLITPILESKSTFYPNKIAHKFQLFRKNSYRASKFNSKCQVKQFYLKYYSGLTEF